LGKLNEKLSEVHFTMRSYPINRINPNFPRPLKYTKQFKLTYFLVRFKQQ